MKTIRVHIKLTESHKYRHAVSVQTCPWVVDRLWDFESRNSTTLFIRILPFEMSLDKAQLEVITAKRLPHKVVKVENG